MAPSSPSTPARPDVSVSRTSLHKSMGVPTLVYFGLSYMVPMTVFTTYGIVNEITGGFLSTAWADPIS